MLSTGERSFLQQKLNLLEEELHDYKLKQTKLNKLNDSILQTYKQNEHYRQSREEKLQKENRELTLKHKEEIRKLKNQLNKDKNQLEHQNSSLKDQLAKAQAFLQQTRLEYQSQLQDLKNTLETKHAKHIEQIETDNSQKFEELTLRLEELNQMNDMYKEYIERKQSQFQNVSKSQSTFKTNPKQTLFETAPKWNKENHYLAGCSKMNPPVKYLGCSNNYFREQAKFNNQIYEIKESNLAAKKVAKQSKKLISELNTRINRAMREIHDDKKLSRF